MQKALTILSAFRLTESVEVGTNQETILEKENGAMIGSEAHRLAQIGSSSFPKLDSVYNQQSGLIASI